MKNMEEVEALKQVAMQKAIKTAALKTARAKLEPGTHEVDFLARVHGTLTVNEDEEYTPTTSVPIKATIALFLRYCGVTRDAALAHLERAMVDALRAAETENGLPATTEDAVASEISEDAEVINEMMERVNKMARALPKQKRAGKVLAKLDCMIP